MLPDDSVLARLMSDRMFESYMYNSGRRAATSGISAVWDRVAAIFDLETTQALLAARHESRAASHVAAEAARCYLWSAVREMDDQIRACRSSASTLWNFCYMTYYEAVHCAAHEPHSGKRHLLYWRASEALDRANGYYRQRHQVIHDRCGCDLGFDGYIAMVEDLEDVNLRALARQAEPILKATRDAHTNALARFAAAAGLHRDDLIPPDVWFVLRGEQFNDLFPSEGGVTVGARTLAGLGIDLEGQTDIVFEIDTRDGKAGGASCTPIRLPGDIRISRSPRGGWQDYASLLHGIGHAEMFAHLSPSLPFGYKWLWDRAMLVAFALLFRGLLASNAWNRVVLDRDPPEELRQLMLDSRRLSVRSGCVGLLYQLDLHAGSGVAGMDHSYHSIYRSELGLAVHRGAYLRAARDFFFDTDNLRGWILEAQIRQYLEREHGEAWFTKREAGDLLKGIWSHGSEHTADEIARQIGYAGLDPAFLIEELK